MDILFIMISDKIHNFHYHVIGYWHKDMQFSIDSVWKKNSNNSDSIFIKHSWMRNFTLLVLHL